MSSAAQIESDSTSTSGLGETSAVHTPIARIHVAMEESSAQLSVPPTAGNSADGEETADEPTVAFSSPRSRAIPLSLRFSRAGLDTQGQASSVGVEDVSAICAEFHNAKRSFRLDDPLPRLMSGPSDRALEHIRAYIDNGCNEVEEVDECKKKGINIFDGQNVSCPVAVEEWYNQVHDYTYERYSNWHHPKTGSFTQMMWSESEEVACFRTSGCTRLGKHERLLCAYAPVGNTVGEYPFSLDQWKSIIDRDRLPQVTVVLGSSEVSPEFTTTTTTTPTTTTSTTTETTTTSTTSTTTTPPPADFTDECIAAHNEKRVTGMTTPIRALSRNSAAIAQAERYRDQMERGGCTFKHSGTQQFGENLYKASFHATCASAVALWYNEKKKYTRYTSITNSNYASFGHFTQVMWANTTGLGCAYSSRCGTVVCNYYPPGNYLGQYPFSQAQYRSMVARDGW
ncbi:mucin family glycoprotein [Cystoisospora suis]|uniref:Mucin family glycoprotein n=1 Tax=Cystoisospora suis TaxID=483139 RepID=A0A2C6L595_9APIC|nr:mucin family glycoprotein [Cystoisospora suis]